MGHYPILRFLERHGGWLSVVVGATPLVAGLIAAALGQSPWWVAAGAVTAAVLFLVARSYIELIRLMTDMLLPK